MIKNYHCLREIGSTNVRYIDDEGKEASCTCPNMGVNPTENNSFFRFKDQYVVTYSRDCPVHGEINNPSVWR